MSLVMSQTTYVLIQYIALMMLQISFYKNFSHLYVDVENRKTISYQYLCDEYNN